MNKKRGLIICVLVAILILEIFFMIEKENISQQIQQGVFLSPGVEGKVRTCIPSQEICDGEDNDCDVATGIEKECGDGVCGGDLFDSFLSSAEYHADIFSNFSNLSLDNMVKIELIDFNETTNKSLLKIFYTDSNSTYELGLGETIILENNLTLSVFSKLYYEMHMQTIPNENEFFIELEINQTPYLLSPGQNQMIINGEEFTFYLFTYGVSSLCSIVSQLPGVWVNVVAINISKQGELCSDLRLVNLGVPYNRCNLTVEFTKIIPNFECIPSTDEAIHFKISEDVFSCSQDCGCNKDHDCILLSGENYYCQNNNVYGKRVGQCVNSICELIISDDGEDYLIENCGEGSCAEGLRCCLKEPEPFFPIGLWDSAFMNFNSSLDLNVNTIFPFIANLSYRVHGRDLLFLEAQEHQLKVISKYERFEKEQVNFFCGYDSLFRHMVGDEPSRYSEILGLANIYSTINSVDSSHPANVNVHFYQTFDDFLEEVEANEFVMDVYPFGDSVYQDEDFKEYDEIISNYAYSLSLTKNLTQKKGIPFWATTQDFYVETDGQARVILPEEIRLINNLPLVYGAKGIFYFILNSFGEGDDWVIGLLDKNGEKTDRYYEVQDFNLKLQQIAPILLDLDSTGACNSRYINLQIDDTNNIINGCFEEGSLNWGAGAENAIIEDSDFCYSGNKCAKAIRGNWGFDQSLTLEPNTFYELSFWLKDGTTEIGSRVAICSEDDVGWCGEKYISCGGVTFKGEGWEKIVCAFTSPESTDNNPSLVIMAGTDPYDENEYHYVDGIVLKKTNRGGFSCNIPLIYQANGNVEIGTFLDKNEIEYIMVVNRDTINSVATDILLNSKISQGEVDLTELLTDEIEEVDIVNGKIPLIKNLEPGEGKIYRVQYPNFLLFNISQGWSLISFNKLPQNKSIENIFSGSLDKISVIKTGDGEDELIYDSVNNISTLEEIGFEKSYDVYSNQNFIFSVVGQSPEFPLSIELKYYEDGSFKYIGYPYDYESNVEEFFAPIWDKVSIIQGQDTFIVPGVGGTLTTLEPGQGYKIGVTENLTFYFPIYSLCGDANNDEAVNIFDTTYLISYLYLGGPAPEFPQSSDVNKDNLINIFDVTYLISYLYLGGPEPDCSGGEAPQTQFPGPNDPSLEDIQRQLSEAQQGEGVEEVVEVEQIQKEPEVPQEITPTKVEADKNINIIEKEISSREIMRSPPETSFLENIWNSIKRIFS
ncbi:MAG: carbohydrate binding domain-containing protein [Nanoarchaeota archaeon]|nr:carbohydrate binding domain-containing protein [Nanoarchaeota archaeon]MBU1027800.1 carbohydrate binding domain-containing protein [Nanoarchaeota archaeon]